ncbi:MAG: ABC transporter permease [Phycisphaerae bacterium]|jgi:ABC-type lipoprotein release transport system permease subunit
MPLPLTYNWRNLFVRKLSTSLTFVMVAMVVFVLAVLLAFSEGIRASLAATGSPDNVIVLNPGSTAESTSIIVPEDAHRLVQTPGVARDAAGRLMISQELCAQTSIPRRGPQGTPANVAVRGVDEIAFAIHRELRLVEGRCFEPGALEVVVGQAARRRYANLDVGGQVALGRNTHHAYRVVGIFEAAGGALESEIWAPRTMISDSFARRVISSALIRIEDPALIPAAVAYIKGPAVNLDAKAEIDYYKDLSAKTLEIVVLTTVLVAIMGVGAAFAVANTMYAAVDGRRREIAMLRTIGFSRRSIMTAFVVESLLICSTACVVGLAASFFFHGSRQDFLSDATWTVLAFELKITRTNVLAAFVLATLVGVIGALAPAVRAARTQVIEALRKA